MTWSADESARDQYELIEACGYGLDDGDLRRWSPLSPIEVHWARKHGLPPAVAIRWAHEGVAVRDAVRAVMHGMAPEDVRPWAAAGFHPADAVEAREAGMTLTAAAAWLRAGYIVPDAALLVRDGWTLAEATAVRFADVDRYPGRASGASGPSGGTSRG